jgi:hypothetical protein
MRTQAAPLKKKNRIEEVPSFTDNNRRSRYV